MFSVLLSSISLSNLFNIDVSSDNGESWTIADLYQPCVNDSAHAWGWCLWTARVTCHPGVRIVSRAGKVSVCM